jgi:hypothetical protein
MKVNDINTCDVLLVGANSFLSKAIQKFEKCAYSHAALFIRLNAPTTINNTLYQSGLYVAEMLANGLCFTNFDDYIKGSDRLLILKPKYAVNPDNYCKNVFPMLGKEKYGFVNLFLCQPIKFLTNYRIWFGDVSDNAPPRMICGEFVEDMINRENPDLFQNWMRDAPSDLYNSDQFTQYEYSRTLVN